MGERERKVSGSSISKNFAKKLNRAAAAALDACTATEFYRVSQRVSATRS